MPKKYLETIRAVDGVLCHLQYHQERLNSVVGDKKFCLSTLLLPPPAGLYRCRVVYDAAEFAVTYIPYKKSIIQSLKLCYDDTIEYAKKYENRDALMQLLAQKGACDDILIVKHNLLTDTSIANIALFNGSEWVTPKSPLLAGTCRARLLAEGKIVAADIHVADLKAFKSLALLNAMRDFDIIAQDNLEDVIC